MATFRTNCITLQHIARHCKTLQDTARHCKTLQDTATLCNTLQHSATHCNTLQHTATLCIIKWRWVQGRQATRGLVGDGTTLHHTAPHCNTPDHVRTAGKTKETMNFTVRFKPSGFHYNLSEVFKEKGILSARRRSEEKFRGFFFWLLERRDCKVSLNSVDFSKHWFATRAALWTWKGDTVRESSFFFLFSSWASKPNVWITLRHKRLSCYDVAGSCGVATITRLLKTIGFFGRISSLS